MKTLILALAMFIGVTTADATTYHLKAKTDSVLICQSRSAYAYHSGYCRGLQRCTHGVLKVTKAQAIKMGYKPCKICY